MNLIQILSIKHKPYRAHREISWQWRNLYYITSR